MATIYDVSVPATSANLGPGFDTLALAVDLRLTVKASLHDDWTFDNRGEGADLLPGGEHNLIARAYRAYCDERGWTPSPLSCRCDNDIPVSRGLGSSAVAIVSGMALAQMVHGQNIDHDQLFIAAAKFEGHPDNVGAAVYGGLQQVTGSASTYRCETLSISENITIALGIPDEVKSTESMRQVIPETISPEDAKATADALRNVLIGLETGDNALLKHSEYDRRHQPYRLDALPSSRAIFDLFADHPSIAGAYLSGAGTTVGGFVTGAESLAGELSDIFNQQGIAGIARQLTVARRGATGVILET